VCGELLTRAEDAAELVLVRDFSSTVHITLAPAAFFPSLIVVLLASARINYAISVFYVLI
jgi:hypothetical protein